MSAEATDAYEGAREVVRKFLNAASTREIIYTRGTTEALNLLAHSLSRLVLEPGDEILIAESEHHSNIVPWQIAAELFNVKLVVAPINDIGEVEFDSFRSRLTDKTKIVSIGHVSNALGTINPVREMVSAAHELGAAVIVDGAQAVAHAAVDVAALDCDFYAFSGHKVFGPTGIGVLYGKEQWLDRLPPYQSGGDMISEVSFSGTTYNELPYRFEAGTPNIAGAIGLGAALEYVMALDLDAAIAHESELLSVASERLLAIDGAEIIGRAAHKAGVLSFTITDVHPHDLGTLLDHQGVAIRTGHHCAMPVMQRYGISGTARASLAMYNNLGDIDRLFTALDKALKMLR